MRHFPQLSTGALAQFPLTAIRRTRTVMNEAADGSIATLADASADRITWTLHYVGLSDVEVAALESLFVDVRGRKDTFVFLDPTSNLLRWSEDLAQPVWSADPMLAVSRVDDAGWIGAATFAIVNAGQSEQRIAQELPASGDLHYCLSFYARSAAPVQIAAETAAAGAKVSSICRVRSEWQRFSASGRAAQKTDAVRYSIIIPAGASVEATGIQVEAQPTASSYKPTYSRGGVYGEARFADDELRIRTDGVNNHSTTVRVTADLRRA